jgi:hypothetical protein
MAEPIAVTPTYASGDLARILERDIAIPGKLDEPVTWWTGDVISYRGVVWGEIRHRSYHLGELVYLRQAMGVDEPRYFHEK